MSESVYFSLRKPFINQTDCKRQLARKQFDTGSGQNQSRQVNSEILK